ncbi:MAG: carbonic anhydrase [Burkholderiaceae bacterium]
MTKIRITAVLMATAVFGWSGTATAQHWSYKGEAGPENWSKVDPKFAMCAIGKSQSPIDVKNPVKGDLKPIKTDYKPNATNIVNNGHTVQVNFGAGSMLMVDGSTLELKQFHFHSPSENKLNGRQFPLEAHLVHADKDGKLAVVAVMFEEGADNAFISKLWSSMPEKPETKNDLPAGISAAQLLPADLSHYRFEGSLTTPPCSEGVRWMIIRKPATVSKAQAAKFSNTLGFANNRPIQAVNARQVLQ